MATPRVAPLVERLGYHPDARLIIINCDDLGVSGEANDAIVQALGSGTATSATWMAPCPAAPAVARRCAEFDVGVHLTLNSEWPTSRWTPLTAASSLVSDDGAFYALPSVTAAQGSLEELREECRAAQVDTAIASCIDISHLDSHMHVLMNDALLARVLVDLGHELDVPVRLRARQSARGRRAKVDPRRRPMAVRRYAARRGVLAPDTFVDSRVGSRAAIKRALADLTPGVTELMLHPAVDSPALREMCTLPDGQTDWEGRLDDNALLTSGELQGWVEAADAELIGYRELRDLQRSERGRRARGGR